MTTTTDELRERIISILDNYYQLEHKHCSEECGRHHTENEEIDAFIDLVRQCEQAAKREVLERLQGKKHTKHWCIDCSCEDIAAELAKLDAQPEMQ